MSCTEDRPVDVPCQVGGSMWSFRVEYLAKRDQCRSLPIKMERRVNVAKCDKYGGLNYSSLPTTKSLYNFSIF